ncbi:MAG: hypothetical protein ABIA97_07235 [Candidatus Omnitrophota bacterium]
MMRLNKGFNLKIISITIAIICLFHSNLYASSFALKTILRVPSIFQSPEAKERPATVTRNKDSIAVIELEQYEFLGDKAIEVLYKFKNIPSKDRLLTFFKKIGLFNEDLMKEYFLIEAIVNGEYGLYIVKGKEDKEEGIDRGIIFNSINKLKAIGADIISVAHNHRNIFDERNLVQDTSPSSDDLNVASDLQKMYGIKRCYLIIGDFGFVEYRTFSFEEMKDFTPRLVVTKKGGEIVQQRDVIFSDYFTHSPFENKEIAKLQIKPCLDIFSRDDVAEITIRDGLGTQSCWRKGEFYPYLLDKRSFSKNRKNQINYLKGIQIIIHNISQKIRQYL